MSTIQIAALAQHIRTCLGAALQRYIASVERSAYSLASHDYR